MEDLNPVFGFEGRKDIRDYPNRPASYRKGYEYITLSLSSRAKTILIMNAIGDIIAIGGVGLVGFEPYPLFSLHNQPIHVKTG